MLKEGRLPKGDALKLAEAAGLLAVKRTPEAIPLCHPLPIDKAGVSFELDASLPGVRVSCEVVATAKTGVEMEALSGATAALLSVWDVVKQVDPALEIGSVRLELKEGGKSGLWIFPKKGAAPFCEKVPPSYGKAAVITVSDRCSRGEAEDRSGPELAEGLRRIGFETGAPVVVPDDPKAIESALRSAARKAAVVALTGGTGLSPRDVTPETLERVCDRLIPGLGEALRSSSDHPMAPLSRSVAGQLGQAIVVALPGSRGGVGDGLRVLERLLPHAIEIVRGGDHPMSNVKT